MDKDPLSCNPTPSDFKNWKYCNVLACAEAIRRMCDSICNEPSMTAERKRKMLLKLFEKAESIRLKYMAADMMYDRKIANGMLYDPVDTIMKEVPSPPTTYRAIVDGNMSDLCDDELTFLSESNDYFKARKLIRNEIAQNTKVYDTFMENVRNIMSHEHKSKLEAESIALDHYILRSTIGAYLNGNPTLYVETNGECERNFDEHRIEATYKFYVVEDFIIEKCNQYGFLCQEIDDNKELDDYDMLPNYPMKYPIKSDVNKSIANYGFIDIIEFDETEMGYTRNELYERLRKVVTRPIDVVMLLKYLTGKYRQRYTDQSGKKIDRKVPYTPGVKITIGEYDAREILRRSFGVRNFSKTMFNEDIKLPLDNIILKTINGI